MVPHRAGTGSVGDRGSAGPVLFTDPSSSIGRPTWALPAGQSRTRRPQQALNRSTDISYSHARSSGREERSLALPASREKTLEGDGWPTPSDRQELSRAW